MLETKLIKAAYGPFLIACPIKSKHFLAEFILEGLLLINLRMIPESLSAFSYFLYIFVKILSRYLSLGAFSSSST